MTDTAIQGWPLCFRAVVAVVLMLGEAIKISLHVPSTSHSAHDFRELLTSSFLPYLPSTPSLLQLHAFFLEYSTIILSPGLSFNPATSLLPLIETKDNSLPHLGACLPQPRTKTPGSSLTSQRFPARTQSTPGSRTGVLAKPRQFLWDVQWLQWTQSLRPKPVPPTPLTAGQTHSSDPSPPPGKGKQN